MEEPLCLFPILIYTMQDIIRNNYELIKWSLLSISKNSLKNIIGPHAADIIYHMSDILPYVIYIFSNVVI